MASISSRPQCVNSFVEINICIYRESFLRQYSIFYINYGNGVHIRDSYCTAIARIIDHKTTAQSSATISYFYNIHINHLCIYTQILCTDPACRIYLYVLYTILRSIFHTNQSTRQLRIYCEILFNYASHSSAVLWDEYVRSNYIWLWSYL